MRGLVLLRGLVLGPFLTDATDALQRPLQLQYGTGKNNEEAQRLQELRVLLLDVVRGETMMWLPLFVTPEGKPSRRGTNSQLKQSCLMWLGSASRI